MLVSSLIQPISGPGGVGFTPSTTAGPQSWASPQPLSGGFMMQSHVVLLCSPAINYVDFGSMFTVATCHIQVVLTTKNSDGNPIIRYTANADCSINRYVSGVSSGWKTSFSNQVYNHVLFSPMGSESEPEIVSHPPLSGGSAWPGYAAFVDNYAGAGNTTYGLNTSSSGEFGQIGGYYNHANFYVHSPAYRKFLPAGATCEATLSVTNVVIVGSSDTTFRARIMPERTVIATTANSTIVGHIRAIGGRAAYRPTAQFSHVNSENDGTDFTDMSYDLDGTASSWAWTFFEGADDTFPFSTSSLQSPSHLFDEEGSKLVRLIVTDNDSGISEIYQQVVVIANRSAQFGSFIDATGVLHSAVNEGNNVRVSRFKSGAASRELLATVTNAKNPSYKYERGKGVHILSYEDRSDGAHKLIFSRDGGKSFQ